MRVVTPRQRYRDRLCARRGRCSWWVVLMRPANPERARNCPPALGAAFDASIRSGKIDAEVETAAQAGTSPFTTSMQT